MYPEWVTQVVIPERTEDGRIIDWSIIEIEANKEIMGTHMHLDNERYQKRKKNEDQ